MLGIKYLYAIVCCKFFFYKIADFPIVLTVPKYVRYQCNGQFGIIEYVINEISKVLKETIRFHRIFADKIADIDSYDIPVKIFG